MDNNLLVKQESETDEKYGCIPEQRAMHDHIVNGIINADKPAGPTSHEVTAWVRDIFSPFGVKKAGHSGTLDPRVTGVLPIALQNAVKVMPALAGARKEYIALMHLHGQVPEDKVRMAFEAFTGSIEQMPPKKSGVKKQLRKRNIYSIEIIEIDGRDVLFRINCEAGTYIRTLCIDIGKTLGLGAHMQELRRTKAGIFEEANSISLNTLRDAAEFYRAGDESGLRVAILPVEYGVQHLGKLLIKDNAVSAICNGAPLHAGGISKLTSDISAGELVAIMTLKGELVAIGHANMPSSQIIVSGTGIAAKTDRVIMQKTVYPKKW